MHIKEIGKPVLVKDLKPNTYYWCNLSNRVVLLSSIEITIKVLFGEEFEDIEISGFVYNKITGKVECFKELADYQLSPIDADFPVYGFSPTRSSEDF